MTNVTKSEILLESGTNEIEIMEFLIGDNAFGINVAKVREIMMPSPVKVIPLSHPAVEGVFKPRDTVLTLINLPKYLQFADDAGKGRDLFIVTNFNKMQIAFRVHSVVGINRVSWKDIQKPDSTIYGGSEGIATGIVDYNNHLITILDFEKIVAEIAPETSINVHAIEGTGRRPDKTPIIMAEDSILLNRLILDSLHKAGYTNVKKFDNGEEAWNYLESIKDEPQESIKEKVQLIITDIEMPKMDGHRLTHLVKNDPKLKNIPLIIFSSLINDEMYIKGKQLGADEQLSKPDIVHLVDVIDQLLGYKK